MDACAGAVVVEDCDVVGVVGVEVTGDHTVVDFFERVSAAGFPPAGGPLVSE